MSLLTLVPTQPAAAATAANQTQSRYITSNSTAFHQDLGCERARRNDPGFIVLHYFAPVLVGTAQGVTLLNGPDLRNDQVANLITFFVYGYILCGGPAGMNVIMGTSNDGGSAVTIAHGVSWATEVKNVQNWAVANGYTNRVNIYGGIDIEPGFSADYTRTNNWTQNGYNTVSNRRAYYNYGSADGCPTSLATAPVTSRPCNGTWTEERLFHVSYEISSARTFPQIYTNSGSMAKQWKNIARYAWFVKGVDMYIVGPMSQYNACLQRGCDSSTDNTPSQAYDQLLAELNSIPETRQTIAVQTDINWDY